MKKVAKFSKVSYPQFEKDMMKIYDIEKISRLDQRRLESLYYGISLPRRSTAGSAGYDFVSPVAFTLKPGKTVTVPTGIRCEMDENYVLMLYVRSSYGFKYDVVLSNGTGVIDFDYAYADNEGHIMAKFINHGKKTLSVKPGDKIMQGIFVEYGVTKDDNATTKRTGGIGSTGA